MSQEITLTFYSFATVIEKGLGKLMEKVLSAGHRAMVLCPTQEYVRVLNTGLWTYHPSSFLPHGVMTGPNPDLQPILLFSPFIESEIQRDTNEPPPSPDHFSTSFPVPPPNKADILVVACPQDITPTTTSYLTWLSEQDRTTFSPYGKIVVAVEGPIPASLTSAVHNLFPRASVRSFIQTHQGEWKQDEAACS